MEKTVMKKSRAGWREDEIDRLWHEIRRANESGLPLRSVFEQMGDELGRKPNSVRNYYYMRLREQDHASMRRCVPFETFSDAQVRDLIRSVLLLRAQGKSVRAAVMELADGDHQLMLRFQNKYRAVIKKRPALVEDVCRELQSEGVSCVNPLHAVEENQEMLRAQITEHARLLGDPDVMQLLSGLDALLSRAVDADVQVHCDRMQVQLDLAQLRFDNLSRAAGDMLLMCKEYLGQEEDTRMAVMPAFLSTLSAHVARMENAMQS